MQQKILDQTRGPENPPVARNDKTLWFEKPAATWIDALPIGNGRLRRLLGVDREGNEEIIYQMDQDPTTLHPEFQFGARQRIDELREDF